MFSIFAKLNSLLTGQERRRVALVFALLLVVAIVEALGIASILPFIAVLSNRELIEENQYLAFIYDALNFASADAFLIFLGLVFFVMVFGSLLLQAIGAWAQLRFSHNRTAYWSSRLLSHYLRQPYPWFLNRNSADLGTSVLAEVMQVVTGALLSAMQMIANLLVAILLLALLLIVDPILAISVGGLLGTCYLAISFMLKNLMSRVGEGRRLANKLRFKIVQEAFTGIKDVKVSGLENVFLSRFELPAHRLAKYQVSAGMIAQMPSFAMQALLFGGMILVLVYGVWRYGGFNEALPVIALFALAGYRLMPAIQKVYASASTARVTEAALDALCADLDNEERGDRGTTTPDEGLTARLSLQEHIDVRELCYRYPGADRRALDRVTLNIPSMSTVGFVGPTGSGKTTLVDALLGLLPADSGSIEVDGVAISASNTRQWQRCLGYVPQQIFLADDTIAANIAFGVPKAQVDAAAVERASRAAHLHDFVESELSDGYDTPVGDRGVRLSGGQRQRIGIARALYHDPDVLVMDEATSALDNITEKAVMRAVAELGEEKTIILIAHRLTTVRDCDRIFLLDRGQVVDSGTYEELVAGNERFRKLALES